MWVRRMLGIIGAVIVTAATVTSAIWIAAWRNDDSGILRRDEDNRL